MSVDQEHAEAMSVLGLFFYASTSAQNFDTALHWLLKSASKGNEGAQYFLGEMHSRGEGVTQCFVEAAQWYRKSADQGNADAQFMLGGMYYKGEGLAQSFAEATQLHRKSADQGHVEAQCWVDTYCVCQVQADVLGVLD